MSIEVDNAKEEAREIASRCFKCGLCKSNCAVLRIMREEQFSPRGKAVLLNDNVFERVFYECNLCKTCEIKCPHNLKLCDAFRNARKVLVGQKRELVENKEVIKNLETTGNIYGIKEKVE
jgi:heterodisulfide reductase subunit C